MYRTSMPWIHVPRFHVLTGFNLVIICILSQWAPHIQLTSATSAILGHSKKRPRTGFQFQRIVISSAGQRSKKLFRPSVLGPSVYMPPRNATGKSQQTIRSSPLSPHVQHAAVCVCAPLPAPGSRERNADHVYISLGPTRLGEMITGKSPLGTSEYGHISR